MITVSPSHLIFSFEVFHAHHAIFLIKFALDLSVFDYICIILDYFVCLLIYLYILVSYYILRNNTSVHNRCLAS